jgi:hypothetical protein
VAGDIIHAVNGKMVSAWLTPVGLDQLPPDSAVALQVECDGNRDS